MTYTYYPGCSLHATGVAYDKSTKAVFDKLGVELEELEEELERTRAEAAQESPQ